MARKPIPIITERCPHCGSEVNFKRTMRWHKCPVCGNHIKPCSFCDCDKTNCDNDCPLKGTHKPVEKIGAHVIDELVINGDYLDLIFDWEQDEQCFDGESFKIHVSVSTDDGSVHFYEERYDLNLNLIDYTEKREHLTNHEAKLAVRKIRKVANKLEIFLL